MKFFKALAATACALALASAVQAATYTDSSDNYDPVTQLDSGVNNGSGFFPWEIEKHGEGDGWAGFGVWNPSANGFQGTWEGKAKAFGIIGKGPEKAVNAVRRFRAPLAAGDSFSFDMAVNWDSNSDIYALKGFAISAGDTDLVVVNHLPYPGNIAINGEHGHDILNAGGTYPMTWTFTAVDDTTLAVTATPRDGSKSVFSTNMTVSTSAIDRIRLQSARQNNVENLSPEAIEAGETQQDWADRRQTYFDNFKLEIAADLPEIVNLAFSKAKWDVTSYTQDLDFALTRDPAVGTLDVTVSSSDPSFVGNQVVSFAEGASTCEFTLHATLTGSCNYAKLTASAPGCNPATYEVKGPNYTCIASQEGVEHPEVLIQGGTRDFYVNNRWKQEPGWAVADNNKVSLRSTDQSVVKITSIGNWEEDENGSYSKCIISAAGPGTATIQVSYNGPKMCEYDFTVLPPFELSGPKTAKTGEPQTYTLKAAVDMPTDCAVTVTAKGDGTAEVSPDAFLVDPSEAGADGFVSIPISVTFNKADDFTLTVDSVPAPPQYTASINVTVSEPTDYSKFIAYDDASLYGGTFDFASTGKGSEGFQPWTVWKADAQYGDTIVTTADGGFPAILSDGSALAIYANNGETPAYAIVRPFANDLQRGQKASIEFLAPQEGGYRKIYFSRIWEGTPYNRFQIWASGGKVGVTVEDGDDTELNWSENSRRIVASVQLAADGSSYTLSLAGYNEGSEFADDVFQYSMDTSVGSWGDGIQGIAIDGWDLPNDFIFNRLAIEQVEEPIDPPPPAATMEWTAGVWNPDEVGVAYTFGLKSGEAGAIGPVDLSVEPAEGIELSADQIDLSKGEATFTVTLTGETLPAGTKFTITAKAQAEAVDDATYELTATEPSCTITPQFATFAYEFGGTVEFSISGTPSRIGVTVDLDSDNENILMPPSPATAVVGGTFTYTMSGLAEGETYIHATYEGTEWGYAGITINGTAADDPNPKVLPITGNPVVDTKTKALTLTVEGTPKTVYGATKVVDREWNWQPIAGATIDGGQVTIDMSGISFMVIKVEK